MSVDFVHTFMIGFSVSESLLCDADDSGEIMWKPEIAAKLGLDKSLEPGELWDSHCDGIGAIVLYKLDPSIADESDVAYLVGIELTSFVSQEDGWVARTDVPALPSKEELAACLQEFGVPFDENSWGFWRYTEVS